MNNIPSAQCLRKVFDRVVCINLKRRPERWASFHSRIDSATWPFSEVERFDAIDGRETRCPAWLRCGDGAWGCLQSHIHILEQALADKLDSLLILEDDASPVSSFLHQVTKFFNAVPADWDALLLGGQHLVQPQFVSPGVVRVINGNRTHAHALRGRYIQAAYDHLCNYVDHSRHPRHHVDHRLGILHLSGHYNVYAPSPWLVEQAEGKSDISGQQLKSRVWDDSVKATPPTSEIQAAVKRLPAGDVPLVVVVGLYRSGCRAVVGALKELGAYLGKTSEEHLEEIRFRNLCCNFFSEPRLHQLCPPSSRQRLLSDWAAFHRLRAKRYDCLIAAAKHPVGALVARDLKSLLGDNVKFIVVDRQLSAAANALEQKGWGWNQLDANFSQCKLQAAIDSLTRKDDCLRICYETLRTKPQQETKRLVRFLGLRPTPKQVAAANRFITPFSHEVSEANRHRQNTCQVI